MRPHKRASENNTRDTETSEAIMRKTYAQHVVVEGARGQRQTIGYRVCIKHLVDQLIMQFLIIKQFRITFCELDFRT